MRRSPLKRKTPLSSTRKIAVRSIVRVCAADGCSIEFRSFPSQARRFCSPRCAYNSRPPQTAEQREKTRQIMLAKDRTGAKNPRFRHGRKAGKNLRGWNPPAKGETSCRACGSSAHLQLHHVVPRSICGAGARRNLLNGIVLCASCHIRWHRGTLVITRDLFTADEWAYLSSIELTGREITGWLDKHYPATKAAVA